MSLPPTDFGASASALFLDVDGTLVDIESHPGDVRADRELIALLDDLAAGLGGALSLISGRSIAEIDRIFEPARFPSAGSHGAELRFRDGDVVLAQAEFPREILQRARTFAGEDTGLDLAEVLDALLRPGLAGGRVADAVGAQGEQCGPVRGCGEAQFELFQLI